MSDKAYIGGGVYVDIDGWGTITLNYGGPGAPSVILNREAIENLWVYLKRKPLGSVDELKRTRAEELRNQ